MLWFFIGLICGIILCLLVGGSAAWIGYRRLLDAQARAQQNQRLAELGTVTGGLAHEIKNPLSTIQLNLQLLLEDIRPDDPLHGRFSKRISTVQREASRLKEILDDFLRYAGRMELQPHRVELNGLLDELVDFLSPQAQLQRVQIRLRRSPEPVYADLDPRLIKQALLNLMLNGMQAMGENGGDLILSVAADSSNTTIEVIDTGRGMPEEVRAKMFQAYFSLRKGGTGLGLAMAKRIIEEHGGRISVCSEVGKGTDFRIVLPLKRSA